MKIFGIGLNKTGTKSLGSALKILGFKDCLAPYSFNNQTQFDDRWQLLKQWNENNIEPIILAAKNKNNFEDWPWPLVYKEMYSEFDDAKFILTIRKSSELWYKSLSKHAKKISDNKFEKLIYGYYMPHDFKKDHINFYNNHNKSVIDFFNKNAPEKLLVICFEDEDNWEKICTFLNKNIPKNEFPFLNNSKLDKETTTNKFLVKLIRFIRKTKKLFNVKTKLR